MGVFRNISNKPKINESKKRTKKHQKKHKNKISGGDGISDNIYSEYKKIIASTYLKLYGEDNYETEIAKFVKNEQINNKHEYRKNVNTIISNIVKNTIFNYELKEYEDSNDINDKTTLENKIILNLDTITNNMLKRIKNFENSKTTEYINGTEIKDDIKALYTVFAYNNLYVYLSSKKLKTLYELGYFIRDKANFFTNRLLYTFPIINKVLLQIQPFSDNTDKNIFSNLESEIQNADTSKLEEEKLDTGSIDDNTPKKLDRNTEVADTQKIQENKLDTDTKVNENTIYVILQEYGLRQDAGKDNITTIEYKKDKYTPKETPTETPYNDYLKEIVNDINNSIASIVLREIMLVNITEKLNLSLNDSILNILKEEDTNIKADTIEYDIHKYVLNFVKPIIDNTLKKLEITNNQKDKIKESAKDTYKSFIYDDKDTNKILNNIINNIMSKKQLTNNKYIENVISQFLVRTNFNKNFLNKIIVNSIKNLLHLPLRKVIGISLEERILRGKLDWLSGSYNAIKNKINRFKLNPTDTMQNFTSKMIDSMDYIIKVIKNIEKLSDIKRFLKQYNKQKFWISKNFTIDDRKKMLEILTYKLVYITLYNKKFVFSIPNFDSKDSEPLKQSKILYNNFKEEIENYDKLSGKINDFVSNPRLNNLTSDITQKEQIVKDAEKALIQATEKAEKAKTEATEKAKEAEDAELAFDIASEQSIKASTSAAEAASKEDAKDAEDAKEKANAAVKSVELLEPGLKNAKDAEDIAKNLANDAQTNLTTAENNLTLAQTNLTTAQNSQTGKLQSDDIKTLKILIDNIIDTISKIETIKNNFDTDFKILQQSSSEDDLISERLKLKDKKDKEIIDGFNNYISYSYSQKIKDENKKTYETLKDLIDQFKLPEVVPVVPVAPPEPVAPVADTSKPVGPPGPVDEPPEPSGREKTAQDIEKDINKFAGFVKKIYDVIKIKEERTSEKIYETVKELRQHVTQIPNDIKNKPQYVKLSLANIIINDIEKLNDDTEKAESLEKLKKSKLLDNQEKNKTNIEEISTIILENIKNRSTTKKAVGGYHEKPHEINREDLTIRLMGYIDNIRSYYSDVDHPENRTLLTIQNISNMLKRFISTDGFDPDISTATKTDGTPLKIKVGNSSLLSCYIENIAIIIYHSLNLKTPTEIKLKEVDNKAVLADISKGSLQNLKDSLMRDTKKNLPGK